MEDVKEFCQKEGLGLTCSAHYLGDDVRVIDWKKKGTPGEADKRALSRGWR